MGNWIGVGRPKLGLVYKQHSFWFACDHAHRLTSCANSISTQQTWSDSSFWFGFLSVWYLWHLLVLVWNDLPEGIKGDISCHTFPFSGSLSFSGRRLFLGQWFSQDILSGSIERPWGLKAKPGEVVWWGYLPYFNHNRFIFLFPLYILGSALQFLKCSILCQKKKKIKIKSHCS